VISAQIRLEPPDDVVAIRETNEQAFGTTTEARLVDRLRNSTDCISLVATIGGRWFSNWKVSALAGVTGLVRFQPEFTEG
jgi:predicted N-acetyltransferase YhbS